MRELLQNLERIFQIFEARIIPNPVRNTVHIYIYQSTASKVDIDLLNLNGVLLRSLHPGNIENLSFIKTYDLSNVVPGIYVIYAL